MKYPVDPSFTMTQTFAEHEARREKNGWQYYNGGIDWACPEGTPIVSPVNGRVTFAGPDSAGISKGYGLHVRIEEGADTKRLIILAHLSKTLVHVGESVSEEQQVGLSGNTGNSTGPHLHFEVRTSGGQAIDPIPLIESPTQYTGLVVAQWGVNVRSGPGTGFAKVGSRVKGTKLDITKVVGNWAKLYGEKWVCVSDGSSTYVEITPTASAPVPTPKELDTAEKVEKLWAAHPELWS